MQQEEKPGGAVADGARPSITASWNVSAASPRQTLRLLVPVVLVAVASLVALVLAFPPDVKISLGPDFGQSIEATMEASALTGDEAPTQEQLADTASVVEKRLAAYGVPDAVASVSDTGIKLRLHAIGDVQRLVDVTSRTGKFELVEVDRISDAEAIAKIRSIGSGVILTPGSYVALLTNEDVAHVTAEPVSSNATTKTSDEQGAYVLTFEFAGEGKRAFAEVTSKLSKSGGLLVFVVDGVVISASKVSSALLDGKVSVTGGFSELEAQRLAATLDGGVLPVALKSVGSERIAPTAGAFALPLALCLALLAVAVTCVLLGMRYRGYALLALAGALAWLALVLGGLSLMCANLPFYLDIPAYLGLLASLLLYLAWAVRVLRAFAARVLKGEAPLAAGAEACLHSCDVVCVAAVAAVVLSLFALVLAWPPALIHALLGLALGLVVTCLVELCCASPLLKLVSAGVGSRSEGMWRVKEVSPRPGVAPQRKAASQASAEPQAGASSARASESASAQAHAAASKKKPQTPSLSGVALIKAAKKRERGEAAHE